MVSVCHALLPGDANLEDIKAVVAGLSPTTYHSYLLSLIFLSFALFCPKNGLGNS